MIDPRHPIARLAKKDGRYHVDAYAFVFDALSYAHTVLGMGAERPTEGRQRRAAAGESLEKENMGQENVGKENLGKEKETAEGTERHLTGQELCEAIRQYALEQYGYLAKCVLNSWGVTRTSDFGEIVFKLIEVGQMKKTPSDRREDFEHVFDFDEDLVQGYKITMPE